MLSRCDEDNVSEVKPRSGLWDLTNPSLEGTKQHLNSVFGPILFTLSVSHNSVIHSFLTNYIPPNLLYQSSSSFPLIRSSISATISSPLSSLIDDDVSVHKLVIRKAKVSADTAVAAYHSLRFCSAYERYSSELTPKIWQSFNFLANGMM